MARPLKKIPLEEWAKTPESVRPDVRVVEWTYTLGHYEEAFPRLENLHMDFPDYGPVIVHRHARDVEGLKPDCNAQCVFVWWN